MFLKFEDDIWASGSLCEIVNSDNICRIRMTRKRIKIWLNNSRWKYVYVGVTQHNINELKKIEVI